MAGLKDYAAAAKVYKTIETEYPSFARTVNAEGRRLQCESLAAK